MIVNNKVLDHYQLSEITCLIKEVKYISDLQPLKAKIKAVGIDYYIDSSERIIIEEEKILLQSYILKSKLKTHTVSVGRDENGYFFHCGTVLDKIQDSVCNYFSKPLKYNIEPFQEVKLCKHLIYVAQEKANELTSIHLPEIESDWQTEFGDKTLPKEPQDELEYLKKYAFKANLIIEGDRGSGKTFDVTRFAKETNIEQVFLGGHNGIESIDLLGHLVPYSCVSQMQPMMQKINASFNDILSEAEPTVQSYSNNSNELVWKDGALTEAFRKASKGIQTILILDELLRIPQRELNILLTALSPINGEYILRTGRILSVDEGIACEETLKVPVEKLFVVGTTNVGGQYAIDDIDPALAERFIVIRKDTSKWQLKGILNKYVTDKGFKISLVNKLIKFYTFMADAKKQGFVENTPTTRTLSRAISLAEKPENVREYIEAQILLWIGRDTEGYPIYEQESAVKKLIEKSKL